MTPWLSIVTFLPLVGAAVLLAWPGASDRAARAVGLGVSLATFAASLGAWAAFDPGRPGFQLVEEAEWVRSLGVRYAVGVDGISLVLVLLTTFLMPVAILASWTIGERVRLYMAAMLFLETAMVGTFVAVDLLLFFLFFEGLLFPMYLIIGAWGGERRVYAAIKFFLYTMAGSALLLVAILVLYLRAQAELGQGTFDLRRLLELPLPVGTARWLFLAFFVAFAVKVPLFPLHTWLPDAHTEAPTAGSVLLAAILLKVGAYGLIRFNLALFPEASRAFADAISWLALVGIVYGAVVAMMQGDLKRLVAYSSVSHLGFVVLGTFAFQRQAMAGGVLQMVNHGLSTGGLFLLVGMLYERTHTRELERMGGLAARMPWLLGCFLFVALSSLGLPGLNNFVGEFLVIVGTFSANRAFGALAATGVVLAAIYLLWSYRRVAHGPLPEEHAHHPDLSLREALVLAPVMAAILWLGVSPGPVLERVTPATDAALARVSGGAGPAAVLAAPGEGS
ncbi:MAG TPA: NADH-quinone oxidoreductase subunit M [Actinomycetota bacterium]|nr:NADH-quinone oxidoreductase subunit M [Actinomycetota bacterium]